MTKHYYEEQLSAFSLVEESDCFRLKIKRVVIEEHHMEEFLDTMAEWLSSNPDKSLVIDFDRVNRVCMSLIAQIIRFHDDMKVRGLGIQLLKSDPRIEVHFGGTSTMIVGPPPLILVQSLSTRKVLQDIRSGLSDEEIMENHRLSKRGIRKVFRKLLEKGVITGEELAKRKA